MELIHKFRDISVVFTLSASAIYRDPSFRMEIYTIDDETDIQKRQKIVYNNLMESKKRKKIGLRNHSWIFKLRGMRKRRKWKTKFMKEKKT